MSEAAITYDKLISKARHLSYPCSITLSGGDKVILKQPLRIIPKKRVTALGEWQGKLVIVKIFFSRRAAYCAKRDKEGVHLLSQSGITTPALYYAAKTSLSKVHVLIFEYISEAATLTHLWQHTDNAAKRSRLLIKVVRIIAKQHQAGLLQQDMHTGNFLFANTRLYSLDGSAIKKVTKNKAGIPIKKGLNNIARLIAQMSFENEISYKAVLLAYCNFRHLIPKDHWFVLFEKYIAQQVHYLKRKYLEKTQRDCSNFIAYERFSLKAYWRRQQTPVPLPALFEELSPAVVEFELAKTIEKQPHHQLIKLDVCGQNIFLQYYPLAFSLAVLLHLKPAPGEQAWLNYHYLNLLNIPGLQCFALAKKGFLRILRQYYILAEHQQGINLAQFVEQFDSNKTALTKVFTHIANIFKKMAKFNLTYGSMQPKNFMVTNNNKVLLTNFDNIAQHKTISACQENLNEQLYQFMQNWHDKPHIAAIALTALRQEKLLGIE